MNEGGLDFAPRGDLRRSTKFLYETSFSTFAVVLALLPQISLILSATSLYLAFELFSSFDCGCHLIKIDPFHFEVIMVELFVGFLSSMVHNIRRNCVDTCQRVDILL